MLYRIQGLSTGIKLMCDVQLHFVFAQARANAIMMEVERQLATARQSSIQHKTLFSVQA